LLLPPVRPPRLQRRSTICCPAETPEQNQPSKIYPCRA
jgi:hypothetical protein